MQQDNQQWHATILDSIDDGVFTVDLDFTVTSFNRAAAEITGVPRDQALGRKCFDVFRADICQESCALRHTIATGEPQRDRPASILDASGRRVPITVTTAILRGRDQQLIGGVETFRDRSDIELLRREITGQWRFGDIISKNHAVQQVFQVLPDIAESGSTVLLEGPSGSGKEVFARAIHQASPRCEGPFVAVNCGALPDTLLESELFGYRRGAFTDAKGDKPGRFALAEGGTLFLDEIGDVSPALQVRLLRVLQERVYEPLGGTHSVRADVRIIAASNRDLRDLVARGAFREDLFYRLNVIRIALPPLAQRREDIPLLAEHFVRRFAATTGKPIRRVSEAALAALLAYPYPGNVRELENIIEHAFVLCRDECIEPGHLPPEVLAAPVPSVPRPAAPTPLKDAEAAAIAAALRQHHGSRTRTAQALGIHTTTLWRKMKRHGIEAPSR